MAEPSPNPITVKHLVQLYDPLGNKRGVFEVWVALDTYEIALAMAHDAMRNKSKVSHKIEKIITVRIGDQVND
jgi:hypothetical protein